MFDPKIHDYDQQQFKALDWRGQSLHRYRFYDCHFQGCDWQESTLYDCQFSDCSFQDCTLHLASFENATMQRVRFAACALVGINWTVMDWKLPNRLQFEGCNLSHSNFFGLNLKDCPFIDCDVINCNFTEADLSRADFSHSRLSESRFFHSTLSHADFRTATGYAINASVNTLKKTRFALPEAMSLLYSLDIELSED